jgi:hypothetical protein
LETARKSIMAYSEDLKQTVLAYVSAGGSKVAAATAVFTGARNALHLAGTAADLSKTQAHAAA